MFKIHKDEKWTENYFLPKKKEENTVISVAVIDDSNRARLKGLETFIKAGKLLPNVKFYAIGVIGRAFKKFQNKTSPNVKLLGYIPQEDLLNFYQTAKVYCQLSYYESCGVALEEAMSCECVPVVTNKGAMPEVVGDSGYYVNYGDVHSTVDAIKKALNDNNKGSTARRRIIENFSIKTRENKLKEIVIDTIKTYPYK